MKRSKQAERDRHTEWLQRWAVADESAFTRRLMLAPSLTFGLAVGLRLLAWAMR